VLAQYRAADGKHDGLLFVKAPIMSRPWQNFFVSLCLHIALPLLPLGLELWFSGAVQPKSAVLTAALYSMAIGISSQYIALFGLCILASFLFSAVFGFLSVHGNLNAADSLAYLMIAIFAAIYIRERYVRHVRRKIDFFEFLI
jgi:hypothetical protein